MSSPAENCESSAVVRSHLDSWVVGSGADVIHFNCGLHDLRINPGSEAPAITKFEYAANLEHIFRGIASLDCPIIWATTTPVNEGRHEASRPSRRREADVDRYNEIGLEVAARHGAVINDLYAAVGDAGRDELLADDGVHFTEGGYAVLAGCVEAAIRTVLTRTT